MTQELRDRIETIPGPDGWHKSRSEIIYVDQANKLLSAGLSEDDVFQLLDTLYWAAANCYGA